MRPNGLTQGGGKLRVSGMAATLDALQRATVPHPVVNGVQAACSAEGKQVLPTARAQGRLQNVSTTRVESGVLRWTAVNETERRNRL